MYIVDYRQILKEKYNRQKQISDLQIHNEGNCVHIGQVSPGCYGCVAHTGCDRSVFIGKKCLFHCPMCYYPSFNGQEDVGNTINDLKTFYFQKKQDPNYHPTNITFNSEGEPLLYLDSFLQISPIISEIEKERGIKIHKRIYTTGVLLDQEKIDKIKQLDVEEIRFHLSASNFDPKLYGIIQLAKQNGFRITVEEPAWPLHRDKLFQCLPILDEIGIDHLNIDEIDITPDNIQTINSFYPNGRMYKNLNYHLYDEGLVYDIMEEVIWHNYRYSVLDCNSDLCRHRIFRSPNIWRASDHLQL